MGIEVIAKNHNPPAHPVRDLGLTVPPSSTYATSPKLRPASGRDRAASEARTRENDGGEHGRAGFPLAWTARTGLGLHGFSWRHGGTRTARSWCRDRRASPRPGEGGGVC